MFRFIVVNPATGEKREFERPLFPPELKARLVAFTEASATLNATSFGRKWHKDYDYSLHLANDGRITNTGKLPTDDEIAAFLHRLRPFYLQKESLNFNSVCNAIGGHLKDDAVTRCLRYWKRHNDGRTAHSTFKIEAAGKHLNSQEFLDDYLNALEYHQDADRRKVIDKVSDHFPAEAQKMVIVLLLIMRLSAINQLAQFLRICFSREDGRPLTLTATDSIPTKPVKRSDVASGES